MNRTKPELTRIRNHPERAVPEEAAEILSQGFVAHVGFSQDEQPFVIPFSYHYDKDYPDKLYLHGAMRSRTLNYLAGGAPVCVAITLLDGLVYSRAAINHSMNYRSVVVFGSARAITSEDEKRELFDKMVKRFFPGRTADVDYNAPPSDHLDTTVLVEVQIEDWNAKARRGGPTGPDDDKSDALGTRGVIDLREQ